MSVSSRIKQALASIGYYRESLARSPYAGVAVLAYHAVRGNTLPDGAMRFEPLHVRASRLDEHCAVLRQLGCTPVSLACWQDLAAGARLAQHAGVMLTFDDGYRSVLTEALPILERYEIPALVFVSTGAVERGERFWYDALAERDGEAAVSAAKALDTAAWRNVVAQVAMPAAPDDPHAPLTIDEVRRLARHPLITIGAHTVSHPILQRASLAEQAEEIGRAKGVLESWTRQPVTAFAYPNGQRGVDYDEETVAAVRRCGFTHAFTTGEQFAVPGGSPFEIPRFTMLQGISGPELAHRLAYSWPRAGEMAS
jgi:peptidoglycan/xylan/chitin deacetylase (PgdA/CDA1 family)